MKLKYDFETLRDSGEVFAQLKAELYLLAKKFRESEQLLTNVCICIAHLAIQAQWPDFIDQTIAYFSESLESTGTGFRILKEVVEQMGDEDMVIADTRRDDFFLAAKDSSSKVLAFLDKWAENVGAGAIPEASSLNKPKLVIEVPLHHL